MSPAPRTAAPSPAPPVWAHPRLAAYVGGPAETRGAEAL